MDPTALPPAIDSAMLGGSAAVVEMSVWHLFLQADWIVKSVMIGLLAASFWSWAIIFEKARRLRRLDADAAEFEDTFWSGGSLEDLYDRIGTRPDGPMESLFAAAMREWRRSTAKGLTATETMRAALQQRIERVMNTTLSREVDRLDRHMIFLASVGSTAPFIGLFGTVWGIMNSFQAIAVSKNTSLAVVAPGIAEALFATAIGLVAAIPAVIAYNKLSGDINRYAGRLEAFIDDFSAILSRQLQEKQ
jgi:biopolymer transport protein TolQ